MSAGLTGLPRFGLPAPAAKAPPDSDRQSRAANARLRIGMRYLSARVHRPARDGIEMMIPERHHGRHGIQLAAGGDERGARGLEGTLVIPGPALQNDGPAIPPPWHAEAGESLGVNRRLQGGLAPAFAAVGGDHHLGDLALAGIGDAGNLVIARRFHVL